MLIFSTLPSYRWSPSRRKYVRDCGFETTAIIPFGAFTTPSSRSVLTCRPWIPGGRLGAPPLPWFRPINDSNGSRRACLTSLSTGAGGRGVAGFLGFLARALAGDFAAALAGVFAARLVSGLPAA